MVYLTEIRAEDPEDGELKIWAGPTIEASDPEEAERKKVDLGLGYCKIIGVLSVTAEVGYNGEQIVFKSYE